MCLGQICPDHHYNRRHPSGHHCSRIGLSRIFGRCGPLQFLVGYHLMNAGRPAAAGLSSSKQPRTFRCGSEIDRRCVRQRRQRQRGKIEKPQFSPIALCRLRTAFRIQVQRPRQHRHTENQSHIGHRSDQGRHSHLRFCAGT